MVHFSCNSKKKTFKKVVKLFTGLFSSLFLLPGADPDIVGEDWMGLESRGVARGRGS